MKPIKISPVIRVISDNDYAGDPDGLIQLAHQLLSPGTDLRAVIGSHLRADDHWNRTGDSVGDAIKGIKKTIALTDSKSTAKVLRGHNGPMKDLNTPADSEGARFIIEEAHRTDTNLPLYVVCGGSLTTIASAWLMDPTIAKKLIVVWIGGAEHPGQTPPPPGAPKIEYNMYEDLFSAQVIFNKSDLNLWQIPRDAYRQCLATLSELKVRMKGAGKLGEFLFDSLGDAIDLAVKHSGRYGEIYMMGDSALVLVTSLQNSFEPSPSSCEFIEIPRPAINDDGAYEVAPNAPTFRVFTRMDSRLMLEDLYAKLAIHASN